METLEKDLILQLKDCFFNVISSDFGGLDFDSFIEKSLHIIGNIFHAENVSLYLYQDWKQLFDLSGFVCASDSKLEPSPHMYSEKMKTMAENSDIIREPLPVPELSSYDFFMGLARNQQTIGFIVMKDKNDSMINRTTNAEFKKIGQEYGMFVSKFQYLARLISEENKYKQLYRVTEKFHSTMDMDDLLGEIVLTLEEMYPTFSYYLLLSQDNHYRSELPVRELEYNSENSAAMQAYVNGTIQFEHPAHLQQFILYAPLKGKQGVYGVLQVIAPNAFSFSKSEVEFITLLANTAGSALENVQLYQQSRKLIADLRLINDTSRHLNSNLQLKDTITYMSSQIITSFGAQEVGFILYSFNQENEVDEQVLSGSSRFFFTKQAKIYTDYIKNKIQEKNESLFIGEFNPSITEHMIQYRSVMAVPMDISEHLKGITIAMHEEPYYFSFDTFKLLQTLIHHTTLAFTNLMLREEMEKMIITDHLTKLNSRAFLDDTIQQSMKEDEKGTFILIDIDDFKKINDTYGHQIGDQILIQVANLIQANIRGDDVGARWGGEELAIYLPKVNLETGVSIAERIVGRIAEQSSPHVTVSCGVSCWTRSNQSDSCMSLFKRADEALYVAKGTGKNKVVTEKDNTKAS